MNVWRGAEATRSLSMLGVKVSLLALGGEELYPM